MKKIIFCIILNLLAVAIIPLNLFFLPMPEAVSIVAAICIIAANLWIWIKDRQIKGGSKAGRIVLSAVSVLVIAFLLFGSYCNPYWNSIWLRLSADYYSRDNDMLLTSKEALVDLDYAMKYLKKIHPALYHGMPEEMERQYGIVRKNLAECETIDVCTLCREIETIFSILGDAHTHVRGNYADYHYLKYNHEHNQAGDRLIQINGISLEDLLHQNEDLYSYETESWAMSWLYGDISYSEGLRYLGISVEDGVVYTYESANGDIVSYTFYEDDFITYEEYVEFNQIAENAGNEQPFVSYEIDEENGLAILTLTTCTYNEEYRNCLKEMFEEVKLLHIANVAVDLRNNGGGSSYVANEFLRYIDIDSYREWADVWRMGIFEIKHDASVIKNDRYEELIFDGNLYLLTSTDTFSSAMDFAEYIKDNHIGTIIGEAPGNAPGSYGEVSSFKLPNSEIYMQISTKKWYRIDPDCADELIEPDIKCDSWEAIDKLYEVIGE